MTEQQQMPDADAPPVAPEAGPKKRGPRRLRAQNLDEVARKHAARELPNVEPYVAGTLPPNESDPHKREEPGFGEVELEKDIPPPPRWVEDGPPRDIVSICETFDLRPGGHYIRVERRHPRMYEGLRCDGYLGKIHRPVTDEEFVARFGGIDFHLRVYGPDPRGLPNPNTGSVRYVPYTKPISVTYAVPPGQLGPEEDEEPMNGFTRPRGAADAQIHKTDVEFSRHVIDQREAELKEARAEAKRAEERARADSMPLLSTLTDTQRQLFESIRDANDRRETAMREELERERAERARIERRLEEQRDRPTSTGEAMKGLAEVLVALKPGGGETSNGEIERIHREHRETLERIDREHKTTLEALDRRHRDEVAELRRQIDDTRRSVAEHDERNRRELDDRERKLKDEYERREKELDRIHQQRFDDLKERHNSEVRILKNISETQSKTEKAALEQKLAIAESETKKLERDLNASKRDGDLLNQLDKIERTAGALGWEKKDGEADRDWKSTLAGALATFVAKIPETISSAGDAAARLRGQTQARQLPPHQQPTPRQLQQGAGVPPQQQQQAAAPGAAPGIQGRPVETRRMRFASEDIELAPQVNVAAHVPAPPNAKSPADQPTAAEEAARAAGGNGQSNGSNGHSQTAATFEGFDEEAQARFRKAMEDAIDAAYLPEAFARDLLKAYPEQAGKLVRMMTAEQALERFAAMPGTAASAILRRDGRGWVREMWKNVLAITSGDQPAAS